MDEEDFFNRNEPGDLEPEACNERSKPQKSASKEAIKDSALRLRRLEIRCYSG